MQKAEFWIEQLQLEPHPEGGYYRETYRSLGSYPFGADTRFGTPRSWATAIYYLLKGQERSKLHRIHSDEIWFYHTGSPLQVHLFPEHGEPSYFTLGVQAREGHTLQETVPAGCRFGACLEAPEEENFSLVSCVVAPGFDFRDFVFAEKEELLRQFPLHSRLITLLT